MTARNRRQPDQLREDAAALRRAGKSVGQIRQILGPIGNRALHEALRGEPPPEWTRRPNAKDELRAQARELRLQGLDYEEIVAQLGVSKSSVSLWVRDLPRPSRVSPAQCAGRTSERMRRYWAAERPVRAARREAASAAAAASIGDLTDREILIAGAIAYLCEGAKNKPHRRVDRVTFVNSDPKLISFFPALSGHGRHPALGSGLPTADSRDSGRGRSPAILARLDRGASGAVRQGLPEIP